LGRALSKNPDAAEIAIFESLLRRKHVCGVKTHLGQSSRAVNAQRGMGDPTATASSRTIVAGMKLASAGLPPAPAPQPCVGPMRRARNRFVAQETVKVFRQRLRRRVAAGAALSPGISGEGFQVARHAG